ncbi:MAG: AraC family transcriptional regulator [Rhodoferax sp.]
MSWVNTVLGAAERLGVARAQVLAAAGLEQADLQAERWPIDHITRLWRAAVQCTQDSGFGLKAGVLVGPASFNVVSYLLQSAPSLRAAIASVQQYQRLISDGGRFQMLPGDAASWVIYHPRQGSLAFSPHQIEAVLAAVVAFARWVTAQPVRPVRVQFSQAQIGALQGYRDAFACPVEFEQAFSGVLLDNTLLDAPLPQADAQLAQVHQQYAKTRLAALSGEEPLAQQLRGWIAQQLPAGLPQRAHAAKALGLGERTLARRLQSQGLDFATLVDEARRDAALQALAHSPRALADIGQSLGFAEPSTFWRAFKRWTGQTPAQWRRQAGV